MSETKVKKREWYLPYFFYDVDSYTNHFEKMAQAGWKLCTKGDTGWVPEYQAIEPTTIHYAGFITSNTLGMDESEEDHLEELKEAASTIGWNYVCTFHNQLHIFESTDNISLEFNTDAEIALTAVHHSMKRVMKSYTFSSVMWILYLLFCVICSLIEKNPADFFHGVGISSIYIFFMVSCSSYFSWYLNKKRTVSVGAIPSKANNGISNSLFLHITIAIYIILWLLSAYSSTSFMVSNIVAIVFLVFVVLAGLINRKFDRFDSEKAQSSKWKISYIISFIVFFITAVGIDLFQSTRLL